MTHWRCIIRESSYGMILERGVHDRSEFLQKYRFSESSILRDDFLCLVTPCPHAIVAGLSDVSAEIDKNRSVNLVVL